MNERFTDQSPYIVPEQGTYLDNGAQTDLNKGNPEHASPAEGHARAKLAEVVQQVTEQRREHIPTLDEKIGMRSVWLTVNRRQATQKDFDLARGE